MNSKKAFRFFRIFSIFAAALLMVANAAGGAQGAPDGGGYPVTTIFTNISGHPTADVPGKPGVHFGPGTGTTHFDRIYGSPNGNWILSADTDLPTTGDEIIITSDSITVTTRVVEGDTAPWGACRPWNLPPGASRWCLWKRPRTWAGS